MLPQQSVTARTAVALALVAFWFVLAPNVRAAETTLLAFTADDLQVSQVDTTATWSLEPGGLAFRGGKSLGDTLSAWIRPERKWNIPARTALQLQAVAAKSHSPLTFNIALYFYASGQVRLIGAYEGTTSGLGPDPLALPLTPP